MHENEIQSEDDSPHRLLRAATLLFARQGFDATTVKELAEEAGVNVSLVSYHFGGKEGLYRKCIEQFTSEKLEFAKRVLQPPQSLEDMRVRLRMFIEEFMNCQIDPRFSDVHKIIQRTLLSPISGPIREVFEATLLPVHETFLKFFEEAQTRGLVRKELDARLTAQLFWGSICECVNKDHLSEQFQGKSIRQNEHREKVIETFMQAFTYGFYPRSPEKKHV